MAHFLHTADLHLGRAFKSIGGETATKLEAARYQAPETIARLAQQTGAAFVVIAGDLFDSKNPSGTALADGLQALGKIPVPVYAIPGNHDPGGPYGPYETERFLDYQRRYAPNFHLLTEPEPLVLAEHGVVLLPCPATGRPGQDPTAWLRQTETFADLDPSLARVAIAHGGTVDFPGGVDNTAEINLTRLTRHELDYLALGDWHGTVDIVDPVYRYSGTPEADKFPRSETYRHGMVLEVKVDRSQTADITEHLTGRYAWITEERTLRDADDIERLDAELLGVSKQSGRLLKLVLKGSLGVADFAVLNRTLEHLSDVYALAEIDRAGLLVRPGEEELHALQNSLSNPTLSVVAQRLSRLQDDPEQAAAARHALVKLYEVTQRTTA